MTASLRLSIGSPLCMKQLDSRQPSPEIPHSSFASTLSHLLVLRLIVAAVGTKTGLHMWAAHFAEDPGVFLGNKYIRPVVGATNFWKFIYIYIYIYIWSRTNYYYLSSGKFGFPWSARRVARLGRSGACCSFLMFSCNHLCLYILVFSYQWC